MNTESKLAMVIGYLKGIINGHNYVAPVDVKNVKEFIEKIENN